PSHHRHRPHPVTTPTRTSRDLFHG
ncbi:Signaling protein YkoW, partial [Fusarium oxysporum f. sp. albedinis]